MSENFTPEFWKKLDENIKEMIINNGLQDDEDLKSLIPYLRDTCFIHSFNEEKSYFDPNEFFMYVNDILRSLKEKNTP